MQAYLIRNKINGKGYVGITTRSIDRRWYEHRFVKNSCGKLLSKAIKKHGEESFEITVLASAIECVENLRELEKQLISQNNTVAPFGYNLTNGGDGVFGFKHSKESIERMSAQRLGRKMPESAKQKMHESHLGEKNHFFGKIHSEETKKNISKTKLGCVGPWLGKPRSEETKRKISEALKGRPGKKHTDESKAKLSAAHTGKKQKPPTDETRKKLSESIKVSWIKRKQSQKGN
jgi:group I intron endonuclease